MVSPKKQRKTIDPWRCVLVPVLSSDLDRWAVAARRNGMAVSEWIRDRMNRIAPEGP